MALFSSKNKTPAKAPAVSVKATGIASLVHNARVIVAPRITEKATAQIEQGVYVFEITPDANKKQVAHAIFEIYKVKPVSVRIAKTPRKQVFVRGKSGMKTGIKKAYVELKKGDKIEFV